MNERAVPDIRICQCAICQAGQDAETQAYHTRINLFLSRLTEPQRRWYVAMLALQPEHPSDSELARITGLDRKTIRRGRRELADGLVSAPLNRQRRHGGGRPATEKKTLNWLA